MNLVGRQVAPRDTDTSLLGLLEELELLGLGVVKAVGEDNDTGVVTGILAEVDNLLETLGKTLGDLGVALGVNLLDSLESGVLVVAEGVAEGALVVERDDRDAVLLEVQAVDNVGRGNETEVVRVGALVRGRRVDDDRDDRDG